MKSPGKSTVLKKIMNIGLISLAILFLLFLFLFKGKMNDLASNIMREQGSPEMQSNVALNIDTAYNYIQNRKPYRYTFLEFGARGCVACKRMKKVMDKVRENYPVSVQVQFIDVLLPVNQDIMKFFGIVAIPTQVLLDSTGKEYFRHTGFYSYQNLKMKFEK